MNKQNINRTNIKQIHISNMESNANLSAARVTRTCKISYPPILFPIILSKSMQKQKLHKFTVN